MPKLRSLVLVLAFCAFTSAASADDFWTAPLPGYGAPLYGAPAYVAPAYIAPTYIAPAVLVPRVAVPAVMVPADYGWSDDVWLDDAWPAFVESSYIVPTTFYEEPPCDDYTDLLLLNRLESIDQTLQSIEYEVREARHRQDWDRILGRYRH
jgi:hypothetical protein